MKENLKYLQTTYPHRWQFYLIVLLGVSLASLPLFLRVDRGDGQLLTMMAIGIFTSYYFIQWLSLRNAFSLIENHQDMMIQDTSLTGKSNIQLVVDKFSAVLIHSWHWHVLSVAMLVGLSLAIGGFMVRDVLLRVFPVFETRLDYLFATRGILRDYTTHIIEALNNGKPVSQSHLPPLFNIISMTFVLTITHISFTSLSIVVGFRWGKLKSLYPVYVYRVGIVIVGIFLFASAFMIRGTIFKDRYRDIRGNYCENPHPGFDDSICETMLKDMFILRTVITLEQTGMSFVDGGVSSASIFLSPQRQSDNAYLSTRNNNYTLVYQLRMLVSSGKAKRHLIMLATSITVYLSLACILLFRTSRDIRIYKKH